MIAKLSIEIDASAVEARGVCDVNGKLATFIFPNPPTARKELWASVATAAELHALFADLESEIELPQETPLPVIQG